MVEKALEMEREDELIIKAYYLYYPQKRYF